MGCIVRIVGILRIPFTQLHMSRKLNMFSDFCRNNQQLKVNVSLLSFL